MVLGDREGEGDKVEMEAVARDDSVEIGERDAGGLSDGDSEEIGDLLNSDDEDGVTTKLSEGRVEGELSNEKVGSAEDETDKDCGSLGRELCDSEGEKVSEEDTDADFVDEGDGVIVELDDCEKVGREEADPVGEALGERESLEEARELNEMTGDLE